MTRSELTAAVDVMGEEAARWEDAYRSLLGAVDARERSGERMDRRVLQASGGLSVARFEAVCRRHFIRTVDDATQKARAIRAKPAVEAAVAARDQARAVADADVLTARIALAEQSKVMLRLGTLGTRMVGQSIGELRRLARLPVQRPDG